MDIKTLKLLDPQDQLDVAIIRQVRREFTENGEVMPDDAVLVACFGTTSTHRNGDQLTGYMATPMDEMRFRACVGLGPDDPLEYGKAYTVQPLTVVEGGGNAQAAAT